MNLKVKGLVLAVVSALVLNGCDSDKVKADLDHAGHKIGDAAHEVGHKIHDEVERAQDKLTQNAEKESLRQLGLDEADIDYVIKHNPDDAMAVAKNSDRILTGINFKYESNADEIHNSQIHHIQHSAWDANSQAKVAKIWGRVAFVVNSPRFAKRFNEETGLLDPQTFTGGIGDAASVPADYQAFIDVASDALQKGDNSYKLEAFENQIDPSTGKELSSGGNAWGQMGSPELFLNPVEITNSPINQTAPLLLHELTHTFGYTHTAADQTTVQFVPNNIPYFVQLITTPGGMNDSDYSDLGALSQEILAKNMTPPNTRENTDLFTQYFGQ
ncbi:hypothetical protein BCT86_06745 [Vibrio breoganii]|uniref:Uncharacterized protein n=1 Tax=Vibrio breoganii TaxID=553239 RepID=A0AAN1CT83_9VIBR|nr:hypothetical protein [Vibrio breoganii]ANO34356.1 hypothetical protein A6E01_14195 [Vibrio breoganii]PMG77114.1 hypothetical protein BCU83_16010 [Vibrio breoganii]PML09310.1 hypothetical protein BCT86_06745 [Vibrio breoganii]PMO33225.1 hypothetical protein BCT12_16000 [Vibrio breoganii]